MGREKKKHLTLENITEQEVQSVVFLKIHWI